MNALFKCCTGYIKLNVFFCNSKFYLLSRNITVRSCSPSSKNKYYYRYKKDRAPVHVYDAFLILDFESTCLPGYNTIRHQEIIEFPCLWVNGSNLEVVSTFHKYVKPVVHPAIDPFCTHLTGITNEMVENERTFPDVFEEFMTWYDELFLITKATKTVFVTDGNWDLDFMLPEQCKLSNVQIPDYMRHWINIREVFLEVVGKYPKTLKEMLIALEIKREGKMHRGLDDSKNIYKIFKCLADRGHVYT